MQTNHSNELFLVDLPGRNPSLPQIYQVNHHPLHPASNPGRNFIIMICPTVAAMEAEEQREKLMTVPLGQKEELEAQGLLELKDGDYLFLRNEQGDQSPLKDTLSAWVVGGELITPEAKEKLDGAVASSLGPPEERTPAGVYMEQFYQPVKPGTRCYNVANSLERMPGIVAPNAQLRESHKKEAIHKISGDLAKSAAPIAVENMKHAPESVREPLRRRAEMLGLPRIGSRENWAYQAMQCNLASVSSAADGSLSSEMGSFGEAHFDDGDSAGHYTNMFANSQLPPNYDPGYFHLLAFGVFVHLVAYTGFNFQGNRKHGGSGPFPPPGEEPAADAVRVAIVSYPPAGMMNPETTRYKIAVDANGPVFLSPEMMAIDYTPRHSSTGLEPATFFHDGHIFMDRVSQAEFYSRALYDFNRYLINQIPEDVGFTLKPERYFHSLEYRTDDGTMARVPPWELAPPTTVDGPVPEHIRQRYADSKKMWEDHFNKTAGLIPSRFMRDPELREAINPGQGSCGLSGSSGPSEIQVIMGEGEEGYTQTTRGKQSSKRRRPLDSDGPLPKRVKRTAATQSSVNTVEEPATTTAAQTGGNGSRGAVGLSDFKFAFNRASTTAALELEVLQLKNELSTPPTTFDAETSIDTRQDVNASLARVANGDDAPEAVSTLLRGIETIQSALDAQSLAARRDRQLVVTARTQIWQWLDILLPRLARQVPNDAAVSQDAGWLQLLVIQLRHVLRGRISSYTFHSSRYSFHGVENDVAAVFVNRRANRLLAGAELMDAVVEAVPDIVAQWLHYPQDLNRKLSWFVSVLQDSLGQEIVTTDYTWKMIRHFKSTYVVSGSRPHTAQNAAASLEFRNELSQHPISIASTSEHRLYQQYQALLKGELQPADVDVEGRAGPCWARFVHMWKMSLKYTRDPQAPSSDKFYSLLRREPGYYLPIREKAPARIKATGLNSPYRPDVIRTLRGIYSALVWRGATHRTKFFDNHKILFDSWDDLSSTVDAIVEDPDIPVTSRDDQYFCSSHPYGQANRDRTIEQAKAYWTSICDRRWEEFSSSHTRPTFSATLQYFRPRKEAQKIFPNLGQLGSFALAGDLALASVCEMPTMMEMAECILSLKSGGLNGLRDLGLVAKDLPSKRSDKVEAIAAGLEEVDTFIMNTFSQDERHEMGYNMVVLEHSLCKFHRALGKKALLQ